MEHRLTYFATGVHSTVLPLNNFPPAFSVTSTWHTIEHYAQKHQTAWLQVGSYLDALPNSANTQQLEQQYNEALQLEESIEADIKRLAITALEHVPTLQVLKVNGVATKWQCSVPNTEPLTAYGYVVHDGNVHEVLLQDVQSVQIEDDGNYLHFEVNDSDFFAITIEGDENMYLAIAPR